MGLDQFIFKMRKLTADELEHVAETEQKKLYDEGYMLFNASDPSSIDLVDDILDICDRVMLDTDVFDEDAFKKDFDIAPDYRCHAWGFDDASVTLDCRWLGEPDKSRVKRFSLTVDKDAFDSYKSTMKKPFFVAKIEEDLWYDRNEWEFQGELEDMLGKLIENCSWVDIGEKGLALLSETFDEEDFDEYDPNYRYVYHPWW